VAVLWTRAVLATQGIPAVPAGLKLICGLIETHWEGLHPRPDPADMDCYARANALAALPSMDGFLGEALNARLAAVKGVGDLRLRDVEVAFSNLTARKGETAYTREQIDQMLAAAESDGAAVRSTLVACQADLKRLSGLMEARLGSGSGSDLKPLSDVIGRALSLTHEPASSAAEEEASGEAGASGTDGAAPSKPKGGLSGTVSTRAEAIRAIDMICEYLDRSEPTNPAPLFLRRARGLLERNFLELLKELAPAALQDVARSVGVDPASVGPQTAAPPAPAKK
jgi:type VI secretion system protein ImpA